MSIIKSIVKKRVILGTEQLVSDKVVVSESNYQTNGEILIIVKDVNESTIILNSDKNEHVVIKTLTNITIKPDKGLIDETYDEITAQKGACIELFNFSGVWYITSSDGLKLD